MKIALGRGFYATTGYGARKERAPRCHQLGALSAQVTGNLTNALDAIQRNDIPGAREALYSVRFGARDLAQFQETKKVATPIERRVRAISKLIDPRKSLTKGERRQLDEQLNALQNYDMLLARATMRACDVIERQRVTLTLKKKLKPLPPIPKGMKKKATELEAAAARRRQKEHELWVKQFKKRTARRKK